MQMRIPGVKLYRSRHGKVYAYHRATGRRLRAPLGTTAFLAEVERLNNSIVPPPAPRPGTLGGLIAAYRDSPEFRQLAARTRSDYQKVFDYLKPLDGDVLVNINRGYALEIRDAAFTARKRHFANYVVTVLRLLFGWAAMRGLVDNNPAVVPKLRRPRDAAEANRRWTPEELQVVLDAATFELRLPIALAVCTGMREADVLRFPWAGYVDGMIEGREAKFGSPIWMPAHPMLRELLDQAPTAEPDRRHRRARPPIYPVRLPRAVFQIDPQIAR